MKCDNLKAFADFCKKPPTALYMILAKDFCDHEGALKCLLDGQQSVRRFSGETVNADELMSELNSFSLLSDHQCIVLKQVDSIKVPVKEALIAYCETPNQNVTLILCGESVAANTKLYKGADRVGIILDLRKQEKPWEKGQAIAQWARDALSSDGISMDQQAIKTLVDHVGHDKFEIL